MQELNLNKFKVLDLKKEQWIDWQLAEVIFVVDYSGSMSNLYSNWTVQKVLERLFPIAMAFDDNQSMDFILFQNDYKVCPNVTLSNIDWYVKNIALKQNYDMWGTSYSPVLKDIILPKIVEKSWFFWLTKNIKKLDNPVYVIFLTDWECSDKSDTYNVVKELANGWVFIQFIWIGNDNFSTLQWLDDMSWRLLDNADFFPIQKIDSISNEQLYWKMMTEFPSWIKQAKAKNLIN